MPTQITLDQITKRYGTHTVLQPLSLDIPAGEMIAVVGPSGCGKSTLLRLLAGFITPDSGCILFDGRLVDHLPPERRPTSLVFQNYALWPHKTIAEHIAFGLHVRGRQAHTIATRVSEMLELVGLSGLEQRYPGQLSGGQQQRVALARSLAIAPEILLLDEPLSNLDAQIRVQMRSELRTLQQRVGLTTLYVTHDQEEALSVADRVIVMRNGLVEQYATPEEVYHRPSAPFVARFIGQSNLMRGCVTAVDEQTLQVQLCSAAEPDRPAPDSVTLNIPQANWMTLTEPIPGQSVLLAIKPERIHITPGARHPAGRAELRGQVANRSFLGAEEQFTVQTACGDLAVRMVASNLNGQMSIDTTSAVTVTLPPAGILLFAACAPAT